MQAEVRLLGRAAARGSDGLDVGAAAWRTAKTFDLMRVLALSPNRPLPIATVLDLFWPTVGDARAGTSLRTAACQIRKVLGNESVVRVGNGLMLDAWVDVAAYRAVAARVDEAREHEDATRVVDLVREAEALYGGDIDVSDTDCSLLHDARRDLAGLRSRLLVDAAEAAGNSCEWADSLTFAQRAASIEMSDRATRALMRAWCAAGETAKTVEEFERLRVHLGNEYGVDPAPQTRALYLDVIGACTEWPPRETTIGRHDEVRQAASVAHGWLMDQDRPGGVVWLVGQSGSGRGTVAREAARALRPWVDGREAGTSVSAGVDILPDQGALTRELAQTLRREASAQGMVLFAPVSDVPEPALEPGDAVVRVAPLSREDFRRLLRLVLQGQPTQRLDDEMYAESRGLPGTACQVARRRLAAGDLSWQAGSVDTRHRGWVRSRVIPALAALPFAFFGLFGGERVVEITAAESVIVEERSRHALSRSGRS